MSGLFVVNRDSQDFLRDVTLRAFDQRELSRSLAEYVTEFFDRFGFPETRYLDDVHRLYVYSMDKARTPDEEQDVCKAKKFVGDCSLFLLGMYPVVVPQHLVPMYKSHGKFSYSSLADYKGSLSEYRDMNGLFFALQDTYERCVRALGDVFEQIKKFLQKI